VLILVKDMIMEFNQRKASMDISSSTYECQYENEDTELITLKTTDQSYLFRIVWVTVV
jgi:hypothetical protein